MATVRTFDRNAAEEHDSLFRKAPQWLKVFDDGPFAALELNFRDSYFFFTLGGLPTGEVLDAQATRCPAYSRWDARRLACRAGATAIVRA